VLQTTPRIDDCTPPTDPYISDIDSSAGRVTNYSGELENVFSCIALLGSDGCGFEQPLEAMRLALTDDNDFVRPHAALAVIIVTNEDDCSASNTELFSPDAVGVGPFDSFRCFEQGVVCNPDAPRAIGEKSSCVSREDSSYLSPVGDYVELLAGLKPPGALAVATITGPAAPIAVGILDGTEREELAPSCVGTGGEAFPAVRLHQLSSAIGVHGLSGSLCDDAGETLAEFADIVADILP
jgi:hypothetical protein